MEIQKINDKSQISETNLQTKKRNRAFWGFLLYSSDEIKKTIVLSMSMVLVILIINILSFGILVNGLDIGGAVSMPTGGSVWSFSALTMLPTSVFALTEGMLFFALVYLLMNLVGPVIPINRHVDELLKGNFESRIQLRKNSLYPALQIKLNDLAEKIQALNSK